MVIGERLQDNITVLASITNTSPVKKCDDGDEEWYEVCEADKTNTVAIIGKDIDGKDNTVIINKDNGIEFLLDLL